MTSVDGLASEYWDYVLRTEPTYATYLYQAEAHGNDRLPEIGPERRSQDLGAYRRLLTLLDGAEGDPVTAGILRKRLLEGIGEIEHGFHEWAVDHLSGPQVWFLEMMSYTPLATPTDVENLAARLNAFPHYMVQYVRNLTDGVRHGRTAPRLAVERVLGQVRAVVATPFEQSAFVRGGPALQSPYENSVLPAFRIFLEYLEKDYAKSAREDAGVWSTPGGDAAYAFRIAVHTSERFDARTLHETGLEELERLRADIGDVDLAAIRRDPKNFFSTREELLDRYREILRGIDEKLPRYFRRLPRTGYEVLPVDAFSEKDSTLAHYLQPDRRGTRKGRFYANTYKPETRAKYDMAALAAHEAVPGHHLQVALAMELDLPDLRRFSSGFTAYIEGWALYAERLADEMGVYENDLDRVGMLLGQMRRAIRLVVDTGLHAMKWPREKAIQFEMNAVAIPEEAAANDIDRYAVWPGQALAYMVGRREIERLRAEATRILGAKFDLRDFHDVVLGSGAVPLETLDAIVRRWIERVQKS